MDHKELKATLQELHQQLQSGEPVDPEVQVLLQQLSSDVDRLWIRPAPDTPQPVVVEQKESLLDRLLGLTEEFEETHPQLASAIGRVATALSRIGI